MVQAIGAVGNNGNCADPEYVKILMELRKLGIKPTGKKQVDKARLEEEKKKLAEKIHDKIENKQNVQNDNSNVERAKMEEQRLGAMTVAELNKILLGI